MAIPFNDDILVIGPQGFNAPGERAFVFLGDSNNFMRAEFGGTTQFGSWNDFTFNKNQGGTNAELVRIAVSGDVGIGTASPTAKLDVRGTAIWGFVEDLGVVDLAELRFHGRAITPTS
jgi:hypothetical protein